MRYIGLISTRNFFRNLPRYWILIVSAAAAVAAMIFVVGLISGSRQAAEDKARRYFAGDITIQEYRRAFVTPEISNPERWIAFAQSLQPLVESYGLRSVLYDDRSSIFFNGLAARQRRLIGVDWDLEADVLSGMQFQQGGVPAPGANGGVLISTEAARRLDGVQTGDSVLISVRTLGGQFNTVDLRVDGIFQESSFFGYAAYLDRTELNKLMGAPADWVNEMGLFLRRPADQQPVMNRLVSYLQRSQLPFVVAESRAQRDRAVGSIAQRGTILVQTLDSQLAQISELLDALAAITFAIVATFLAILSIGVSNTYSMIVYERTKEIGTLRAMGMQKTQASLAVLLEALILGVVSTVFGFLVGLGALEIVTSAVDLSGLTFASLFLVDGRVAWYLPGSVIALIFVVAITSGLLGASGAARQAGRLVPVEALRRE